MSNPNPPAPPVRPARWCVAIACFVLAGYAIFLARHATVAAGGSDSSGYLNGARVLATGHLQTELRTPPELGPPARLARSEFSPLGFFPYPGNPHLSPTYPIGLPLHVAAAAKLLGWTAGPLAIELAAALGALWLSYATGRAFGLARAYAAAGAAMLALFPIFLFTSIQPLSDTLATTWCLAAVWAAQRSRRHAGWAAAGGGALAVAVLVRPTDILLLPALAILIGRDGRRLALLAAAGLPGAVWQLYYDHLLYGGDFRLGYPTISQAFALAYGPPTIWHFARWLALFLPAPLLVLPFVAVGLRAATGRELAALGAWFGGIVGLYAFYSVSHEGWLCLRFILPAVPALLIAGLLGLQALGRRLGPARPTLFSAATLLLIVAWSATASWYWWRKLDVYLVKDYEEAYADAAVAARTRLPPGALVVCFYTSGALYYYTDFAVLRWDSIDPPRFARYAAQARQAGRPVCALIFQSEEKDLREHCPGEWTALGTVRNLGLWQFQPPRGHSIGG